MKKSTVSLLMLFISSLIFAQNAPITFEPSAHGSTWTWTVFENATNPPLTIIDNPHPTGINTSTRVARFTALQGGQPWAGVESSRGMPGLGPFVLSASNSTIRIMVYKSVISDVGIKLISSNGWAQPEIRVANTLINQWEELTFNFAGIPNPPAAEGQYVQIAIFPDFNTAGRGRDNVILFDNITFSAGTPPAPTSPTVAAPTPTVPAANVISLFSNAYTNVPVDTWRTAWSQGVFQEVAIAGNATKRYSNLNFVGVETIRSQINITGMTQLHLNVWTPNATLFRVKLVDFGANGAFAGGDDTEHEIAFPNLPQNQWVRLDIPLSDFTNLARRQNIAQLIYSAQPVGTTTVYIDNVFFYTIPTGINDPVAVHDQVKVFPNPARAGQIVKLSTQVKQVNVYDITGGLIITQNSSEINTEGLRQGVYIVRIETLTGEIVTERLIIN